MSIELHELSVELYGLGVELYVMSPTAHKYDYNEMLQLVNEISLSAL